MFSSKSMEKPLELVCRQFRWYQSVFKTLDASNDTLECIFVTWTYLNSIFISNWNKIFDLSCNNIGFANDDFTFEKD